MIRYFTLVAVMAISLTTSAQVKITNGILYAENETHITILKALAKYYKLNLVLKGPGNVYQFPIHITMPLSNTHAVLCSLHYNTGMCYTLSGKTLTVDKIPAQKCKCKCPTPVSPGKSPMNKH